MKQTSAKFRKIFLLRLVVLGAAVPTLCGPAAAGVEQAAGVIYYQVTLDGGTVRDIAEPPKTRKGIRRVVRIARFDADFKGYQVLTTEGAAMRHVHTGRTVKHELTWNGTAWIAPQDRPKPSAQPGGTTKMPAIQQEVRKTEAVLSALNERLKQHDHAVAQAERKLTSVKGAEAEAAAAQDLKKARQDREKLLATIKQYKRTLDALKDAAGGKNTARPTGKVEHLRRPPAKADLGPAGANARKAILPHRVLVRKLPPGKGKRTYVVCMRHCEAGRFGALYYIAYADTNGDGTPDKLIARSDLAAAEAPGQWTQWTFTTSEPSVFAGCAYLEATAGAYRRRAPAATKDQPRGGTEVYVGSFFGTVPKHRKTSWPYLSNIRIHVNQNPDAYTRDGPEIIFR